MRNFISFIDFTNMNDEEKYKLLNKKDYEINRLNNIIDELEKWLKEENYKNEDFWCINSVEVLNKLNELKEDNK